MAGAENRPAVVVGIDGSRAALQAVRWAADEAVRRDLPLFLLHVAPPQSHRRPRDRREDEWARGDAWLAATRVSQAAAPRATIRTGFRVGRPAEELIRESGEAVLMVLGSRGWSGIASVLLGSVASTVAANARCPVVVVRGQTPETVHPTTGPVVVGVDGSPDSDAAVGFAFDAAARRGVPLVAVHAEHRASAASAGLLLTEWLAGWQGKYPGVEVRRSVVPARPRQALLAAAEKAQLVVVGARGRGGVTGVALGINSQGALRHGECPVAVLHQQTVAQDRAST